MQSKRTSTCHGKKGCSQQLFVKKQISNRRRSARTVSLQGFACTEMQKHLSPGDGTLEGFKGTNVNFIRFKGTNIKFVIH